MTALSPRRRDRVRAGILSVTALVGAGSLTAVGWFAGVAARQHDGDQARARALLAREAAARAEYVAAMAQRRADLHPPRVVLRPRPQHRIVVTRTAPAVPVTVGGGTLGAPLPAPAPHPTGHAPRPPAAPPPPAPPPPAPTSGS